MITFDDVCFAYEDRPVLQHITFTLKKGQSLALLGPNGAGKSTLLRILNGLIFPERGRYAFDGETITKAKLRDRSYSKWFHQRVGYVWQDAVVQLFCATVEEELAFGPEQMGLADADVHHRVDDALAYCRIEHLRTRPPYTLSGGEKKRVAIASILTMNPAVWTFDEPEAALDEDGLAWLAAFLTDLRVAGKTLVFATHDRAFAGRFADATLMFDATHHATYSAITSEMI